MRRLVALGLLAASLAWGSPAGAAELDPNRCEAAQDDAPPAAPGSPGAALDESSAPDGLCATLLEEMVPGDDPGQFPTSHYDLGYDEGAWNHFWRKVGGWLMDGTFGIGTWLVRIGLGIVDWAMDFAIADRLAGPAQRMADTYQHRIVGPANLEIVFLTFAALWGMWLAVTGRITRGFSEVLISMLIAAAAATMFANPSRWLLDSLRWVTDVSFDVAALTANDPEAEAGRPGKAMQGALHRALVERPHEILNWSRVIPPGDPCRGVYEAAVASGPWGPSDKPRDAMRDAGCTKEARFNKDPTRDRLVGALALLLAGVLAVVLIVMIAATFIGAQIGLLGCIITAPFAFLCGCLPGRGRALFWRWVASAGMALAGVLAMAGLLSLTLVGISTLLEATTGDGLLMQMLMVDLVVIVALIKRRRILEGGRRAVVNFTKRMAGARAGGSGSSNWLRPAAAGAAVGYGIDELGDRARRGFAGAVAKGGHSLVQGRHAKTTAEATRASADAAGGTPEPRALDRLMLAQQTEMVGHSQRQSDALDTLVAAFSSRNGNGNGNGNGNRPPADYTRTKQDDAAVVARLVAAGRSTTSGRKR